MVEESDRFLVNRCQNGDRLALELLVRRYQKPLLNVAYRISGNRDDAEDIVQTTFMNAFQKLDQFDAEKKFFSWLYRIAVNESINAARRAQSVSSDEVADAEAPGPEQDLVSAQQAGLVHERLRALNENLRAVLVLRHFSELSYLQISEILELPEETVKSRLYSARSQLAASIKNHLESAG